MREIVLVPLWQVTLKEAKQGILDCDVNKKKRKSI